jgi:hypothetical protein
MSLDTPTIGILAPDGNEIDRSSQLWIREQARDFYSSLTPNKVIVRWQSKQERWCAEEAIALEIPTHAILTQTQIANLRASEERLVVKCKLWAPPPGDLTQATRTLITLADVLICVAKRVYSNTYINQARHLGCDIRWINY